MHKAQPETDYPWYLRQPWLKILQILGWPIGKIFMTWRSLSSKHERLRKWYEKFWNWYGNIIISAAWECFRYEDYVTAALFANFILQFLPDYPEALCLLGMALANLGDDGEDSKTHVIFSRLMEIKAYCEAEKLAREIIVTYPDNAEYYNWLGQALQEQNKLDEAITAYYKSFSFDPNFPCILELGSILLEKRRFNEARAVFLRAMIYDSSNEDYVSGFICSFSNEPTNKLPDNIPPHVFEFVFPRILAAKYLTAKNKGDSAEEKEIEDLIRKMGEKSPQMAYVGHVIVTGHWNAESRLLQHFKKYIKGPVLNVGCGTGEQSLLAAHFLKELPDFLAEKKEKKNNSDRLTFFLSYKDEKGNRSLIEAFSPASLPSEHKGKTRFILGGIDLEKGRIIPVINLFPKFPGESVELSDHRFTVVSVDIDTQSLVCAARTLSFLAEHQHWLEFLFMPCDITETETALQPHFKTVLACYLFHWLGDKLPVAVHNIASALESGGYLVVLGECPVEYTESPFLEYASSIHGGRKPTNVSLEEIVALCVKEGLRFIEKEEVEIQTLDPKDRHPMFGVVFQKE